MATHEIRADYDGHSIVVYQAYSKAIALAALQHQRFVAPFSLNRMTWIKPSFLWLMERSNWGLKSGQETILAVRITRQGWEEALSHAVLTAYDARVYRDYADWQAQFERALVHVQWDPERTLRGKAWRSVAFKLASAVTSLKNMSMTGPLRFATILLLHAKSIAYCGPGRRRKHAVFCPKSGFMHLIHPLLDV